MVRQELIYALRSTMKVYETMLKEVCEKYELTPIEGNIISFLFNHPTKNSASDIAEYRMLSKGNVSIGVESLIKKNLIERKLDRKDRRKVNLFLKKECAPITKEIEIVRTKFFDKIFSDFSAQEREEYFRLSERILQNAKSAYAEQGEGGKQRTWSGLGHV